ncbi:hypothetical protein [Psychrobacillus sp. L4]|uniref:hypothetical protein n=1 Tax=Psychrobacillus sp. L4 TaxID=3236892 RepID=UPI0036F31DEE
MLVVKIIKPILFLLVITMMSGCINKEVGPVLTKVKGDGLTYSEYFKMVDELDKRENITYYKPLPIAEMMQVAPDSIKNALHPIDSKKVPFEVNEQLAYLVTSKDKKGNLQNQVQFTYSHKNEYAQTDEFFILSVTELDENPLEKYDFSKQQIDTVGNELRKEVLTDGIPIFHQVITTNSALIYGYYSYDEKEKRVLTVGTKANELYGYYNGYLYHVGYYLMKDKNTIEVQDAILQLTREFILGASL